MGEREKEVVWLHERVKSPPFSEAARSSAGALIRALQEGHRLALPHSRPMPEIGPRCHELRINDEDHAWRIIYRIDSDTVVVAAVFAKTTRVTPELIKANCRARFRTYDEVKRG